MKKFLILLIAVFALCSCNTTNDSRYKIINKTKESNYNLIGEWVMINQKDSLFIDEDFSYSVELYNHNFSRDIVLDDSVRVPFSKMYFYNDNTCDVAFYDAYNDTYKIDNDENGSYEIVNQYLIINNSKYNDHEKCYIQKLSDNILIIKSNKMELSKSDKLQWELKSYETYGKFIKYNSVYFQYTLTFKRIN